MMHTGVTARHRRSKGFRHRRERKPAKPQIAPILAVLGTILASASLIIKAAGIYRVTQALERMQLDDSADDRVESLLFSAAGHPLAVGNALLIAGGAFMIYALRWGGFRERWFLWSTLVLALLNIWQPFVGTAFGVMWLSCLATAWRQKPSPAREVILIPE